MALNTYNEAKCCLDICEQMIDRLQREMYSNNSMLGAMNGGYDSMTTEEKDNYELKRKQLNDLLKFRTDMLDFSSNAMKSGSFSGTEPALTIENGFNFSL